MTAHGAAGGEGPLVSLVLPVRGVAEYLPACLDSILGQPDLPAGVEVIAVDDASPDASGAILDGAAGKDPRLRVIHLPESAGPGPARMRGLAEASGEYVWFADPDDLLAPGSLAAIASRLRRDRPDVMLVDYLILLPSGRTQPSPGGDLLRSGPAAGATVTLADYPALINRTMTSWSKVIRRSFLAGLGVSFSPGIHEDVPVSSAALLLASRISLLDQVCYLYRRRSGSFLGTQSMDHFSIFSSYEQVFALARAGQGGNGRCPAPVRSAVFGRAIEHYSSVLASRLVPRRARREFFARMVADYRKYRPRGYHRPPGLRGLKVALIERDAYWAYAVLGPLNDARVAARRLLHAAGRRLPAGR